MVITDIKVSPEPDAACKLKAADILLIHTKRSLWSWLVRFGTRSYWNHALLVCTMENPEQSYHNTMVVDPKTDGSVEMDCVSKYLGRLNKYNVAVKRLEAEWFQNGYQAGEPGFCRLICNIATNEVVNRVRPKLVKIINRYIRQITVIYRFVRRKIRCQKTPLSLPWNIRPIQMKAFTCSGFVQWCYYKAVSQIVEEKGADKSRLQEVLFNPKAKKKVTPFELLTTTPADLASCAQLSWKYVIIDGVIREVSRWQEVNLTTEAGIRI